MIRPFSKSKYTYTDLFDLIGSNTGNRPKYLFYYQYFFLLIYQVLDTVFTPYITKRNIFVPPDKELVDTYRKVINYFYRVREVLSIHGIPLLKELDFFDPLNGSYNRLLNDWEKYMDLFEDHKAIVENLLILEKVESIEVSPRLKNLTDNLLNTLTKQKLLQRQMKADDGNSNTFIFPDGYFRDKKDRRIFHLGENPQVDFVKKESIRMKVFELIFNSKGDWISVHQIAKKVNRDDHYIRQVISELQDLLRPNHHTIQYHGGTPSKVRLIPLKLALKIS